MKLKSNLPLRHLVLSLPVAGILISSSIISSAIAADTSWAPTASERLIKLPGNHLEKAVESDFRKSELAAALIETEDSAKLKQATLGDLQGAIERADGETRYELQHQFLLEKKSYVTMLKENQDLRQKRARIKLRLYERLLGKLNRKKQGNTAGQKQLVSLQQTARARMKSSLSKVDMKLMQSVAMSESRYSREYARNISALENLVAAVNAHPANQAPELNGVPLSQEDYLRQLISQNEAEVALVNQERAIVSNMAKLISLDALALSEETLFASEDLGRAPEEERQKYAIDFFIN
ncbi:MAG: hypothetical protein V7740_10580 [Pseudomonas marincola]